MFDIPGPGGYSDRVSQVDVNNRVRGLIFVAEFEPLSYFEPTLIEAWIRTWDNTSDEMQTRTGTCGLELTLRFEHKLKINLNLAPKSGLGLKLKLRLAWTVRFERDLMLKLRRRF